MKTIDLLKQAFTILPMLISLDYLEEEGEIIVAVNTSLYRWQKELM